MAEFEASRSVRFGIAMLLTLSAGCGGSSTTGRDLASRSTLDPAGGDPCTLLTEAEVAPFVGALVSPPYRSSDGAPDLRGDECLYRGQDGRLISLRPEWKGGHALDRVLEAVPATIANAGRPGLDTMTQRVMRTESAGPWSRATWIPGGSLFIAAGETTLTIDVSGSSGEEREALALARIAAPRLAEPLKYDGARAVALAPRPVTHPTRACDLLTRAEVEGAIGPITGEPRSDAAETTCTWTVATGEGNRAYPVTFAWEGGQKNFARLEHGMATVTGMMGLPAQSPLDTLHPPPQMQAAIGGLMKMMAGPSGQASAPGAAASIGFRTDTTLRGPWDHAALLHGTQLIAVRHDVFVGMDLTSADYPRAKALLAAICGHL